jgi:putative ABC transport system permease protein
MDRLFQDLRFAVRLLFKDRVFTLTTAATVALCVAANTAIFAIVNSVLLKPLPFPEPGRILTIFNAYPGAGVQRASNGVPDYYDRVRDVSAFQEIAMYRTAGVTVGGQGQGEAQRISSMPVTPSFFRLLGATALRGRTFTEEDAEIGKERKVILSYGLWQRVFGASDDAIGRDLRINGNPYTVVGVMPQGWRFIDPEVELWTPAAFTAEQRSDASRHSNNWQQIGRLRPGATLQQAQSQIDAINARNLERLPELKQVLINAGFNTQVKSFQDDLVESSRRTLYLLWGGALFVLVIGCVNVANLVSVRASTRLREMATRHALGASTQRLSRQMLTETLVLAIVGGALGIALGRWALTAVTLLGFDELPRGSEIALDAPALIVSFGLVLAVGVVVGLLPVVAIRRANLAQVVREEARAGTASRGARVVRRLLVGSQVAFALVLLVGAGLLLTSFQHVLAVKPGFDAEHVLTGAVALPTARYKDNAAVRATLDRMLERVRALPGVQAAGFSTTLPMSGNYSDSVILAEGYQMAPGESLVSPSQVVVSEGYFEAMRTRLLRGRYFTAADQEGAARAIIVDERLANKFWAGHDPVGKHMYQPTDVKNVMAAPPRDQWYTVVGVVEDVRLAGLVDRAEFKRVGAYYFPLRQASARSFGLAVRSAQDPASVTSAVRREIAAIDPELPFYGVRTMEERVDRWLTDRRTPMILALSFAAVALFLAAIGIYGVLAYQVSQRRREIGIRIALGAETGRIFGMVLREGALIVLAGALVGLAGAFALRQTLQSQLYEIGAMDPRVVSTVAVILLAVALVACLMPARRAAKTDPVIALTA